MLVSARRPVFNELKDFQSVVLLVRVSTRIPRLELYMSSLYLKKKKGEEEKGGGLLNKTY